MATATNTQSGKANSTRSTFWRQTEDSIDIKADPAVIWALLTNAKDYPRWNSTVITIDGTIKPGERIALKSTLDPKRIFKLKVKLAEPEKMLVWGDSMGERIYKIAKIGTGQTNFSMKEKIGGMMFPLFAKMIPSFDESFEQFAADMKKEAEMIMNEL